MQMTATELRSNLYRTLDRVLETGEPVEILRNGRVVQIVPVAQARVLRLEALVGHPGALAGDPDDLVHLDWSGEWQP